MNVLKSSLAVAALLRFALLAQRKVADKKSVIMDGARRAIAASLTIPTLNAMIPICGLMNSRFWSSRHSKRVVRV